MVLVPGDADFGAALLDFLDASGAKHVLLLHLAPGFLVLDLDARPAEGVPA
jgi:hypothetical protein